MEKIENNSKEFKSSLMNKALSYLSKFSTTESKLRSNLSVLNIYFKQNRIQTANISSSTDQLPTTSSGQTETTPDTSVSNQNNMGTGGGSTVLPSDYGVEKTFCQQFCNRELKNEKEKYNFDFDTYHNQTRIIHICEEK